jgi:hypothetical protein
MVDLARVLTALVLGIGLGGLAAVVYFSWTGTKLIWKKQ